MTNSVSFTHASSDSRGWRWQWRLVKKGDNYIFRTETDPIVPLADYIDGIQHVYAVLIPQWDTKAEWRTTKVVETTGKAGFM